MRKHYGKSPDIFDAAILTFAEPIASGGMVQGNASTEFDPFEVSTGGGFGIGNAMVDFDGFS